MIATEATLDAGFYQQRLHLTGKRCVSSDPLRASTTRLIALIKQNGFTDPEVITQWRALISLAQEAGAQALLIACTDISPYLKAILSSCCRLLIRQQAWLKRLFVVLPAQGRPDSQFCLCWRSCQDGTSCLPDRFTYASGAGCVFIQWSAICWRVQIQTLSCCCT